jgi:hypothetical protein
VTRGKAVTTSRRLSSSENLLLSQARILTGGKTGWPTRRVHLLTGRTPQRDVEEFCEVAPLTIEIHTEARGIAEHRGLRSLDFANLAPESDDGLLLYCRNIIPIQTR